MFILVNKTRNTFKAPQMNSEHKEQKVHIQHPKRRDRVSFGEIYTSCAQF